LGREQAARIALRLAEQAGGWGSIAVYSSTLRRARETAEPIAAALGVEAVADCGLCTWHTPEYADGMPVAKWHREHGVEDGGVFRPFQRGNETWAELTTRVSRTLVELAARHWGGTVVVAAHAETVAASFSGLGLLGHYFSFELRMSGTRR
jgi:probable phosphoglycerate mutase